MINSFKTPYKRKLLCAAVSLSLLPLAGASLAQDTPQVEEVLVTGSYIRRSEGFRASSPVTQIDADALSRPGSCART